MKSSKEKRVITIKRTILVINITIVGLIIFLLLGKGIKGTKNHLVFNLEYGKESKLFLSLLEQNFRKMKPGIITIIYIFNDLPTLQNVKDISKLYNKHKKNVQFFVAFFENFKTDWKMTFPYKTISNTRVTSKFMSEKYDSNYFVLLDNNRVSHVESSINTVETNFLIEKRLSPERDYSSYTAAKNDLKRKLIVRYYKK
jgi:hypothetical protein